MKGVAGMEIIDKYNEHAFTSLDKLSLRSSLSTTFKHARFAITYLEKEWVVLIKAMGVGGKSTYCVGYV